MQAKRPAVHLRSLLEAMTRSQSRTLCFFRNFLVKYLRYLPHGSRLREKPVRRGLQTKRCHCYDTVALPTAP